MSYRRKVFELPGAWFFAIEAVAPLGLATVSDVPSTAVESSTASPAFRLIDLRVGFAGPGRSGMSITGGWPPWVSGAIVGILEAGCRALFLSPFDLVG